MMIVKVTAGDQVAIIENDEQVLGDVRIIADSESQNLRNFLEFELYGKRGLKFGCGCKDHSHDHEHENPLQPYLVHVPGLNSQVIDTSSDEYIIDVIINEICPMYGLEVEIIQGGKSNG